MKRKTVRSDLLCSECGNVFPISRTIKGQRPLYHIKTIYCPTCKRSTDHIEVKDSDLLLAQISMTPAEERTENEQRVYTLARGRR